MFNGFVPNIQLGVEIDYEDGSSIAPEGPITYDEVVSFYGNEREALDNIFQKNMFI